MERDFVSLLGPGPYIAAVDLVLSRCRARGRPGLNTNTPLWGAVTCPSPSLITYHAWFAESLGSHTHPLKLTLICFPPRGSLV
eukprot:scaffold41899_cov35-Tisochrysis_lutea.AAC.1